jgi:hypothetical protein
MKKCELRGNPDKPEKLETSQRLARVNNKIIFRDEIWLKSRFKPRFVGSRMLENSE